MNFAEKLNFLMEFTNISNAFLAKQIAMDASYVSRLRNGKRGMPKDEQTLYSIAEVIGKQLEKNYQKRLIMDLLQLPYLPNDNLLLAQKISEWFSNAENVHVTDIESSFLGSSANFVSNDVSGNKENERPDLQLFYGDDGMREGALTFLTEVLEYAKPQTILLFSDETTQWMMEKPQFAKKIAEVLFLLLQKGHKIKIIHTISRDLSEMIDGITQWMPLHLAGDLKSFYYPKKRDGLFKRSIYVAPGISALVSSSTGENNPFAVKLLHRDKNVVASYELEFSNFLSLCRPLMKIFSFANFEEYYRTLEKFECIEGDVYIEGSMPSPVTMPAELFESMISNFKDADKLAGIQRLRREMFLNNLNQNEFVEIFGLPPFGEWEKGYVESRMPFILSMDSLKYTKDDFITHLEAIIDYIKQYPNYNVFIGESAAIKCNVYLKEDIGVLVSNVNGPMSIALTDEGNMLSAFEDYLGAFKDKYEYVYVAGNSNTNIKQLEDYIEKLKNT